VPNPINHPRWQRPLATALLALVVLGIVAGGVRALRSTTTTTTAAAPPARLSR
jgi:hypothetical protein